MAKIYTMNEGYTGNIAGVSFVNGVGETNDIWLVSWFLGRGYRVVECVKKNETVDERELLELKTVKELKEIAEEKSIKGYQKMKKEELISALAGE